MAIYDRIAAEKFKLTSDTNLPPVPENVPKEPEKNPKESLHKKFNLPQDSAFIKGKKKTFFLMTNITGL